MKSSLHKGIFFLSSHEGIFRVDSELSVDTVQQTNPECNSVKHPGSISINIKVFFTEEEGDRNRK